MGPNEQFADGQWPLHPAVIPQQPNWAERLLSIRRDRSKGKISGLAAAISEYYGIDALLIRSLFVIAIFGSGVGAFCYLAGWLLTTETVTGQAPMDRISNNWRNVSANQVMGWTIGIIAVLGITIGSLMAFGWLPLAVLALTIWTSQKLSYQSSQPQAGQAPNYSVTKSTLAATVVVLLLAISAGFISYDMYPGNLVLALAMMLGVIGLGLIIMSFRTIPIILIASGLILTLVLSAGVAGRQLTSYHEGNYIDESYDIEAYDSVDPDSEYIETSEPYLERLVEDSDTTWDLTAFSSTEETEWHIVLHDSFLTLILPAATNVHIEMTNKESYIEVDNALLSATYKPLDDQWLNADEAEVIAKSGIDLSNELLSGFHDEHGNLVMDYKSPTQAEQPTLRIKVDSYQSQLRLVGK